MNVGNDIAIITPGPLNRGLNVQLNNYWYNIF